MLRYISSLQSAIFLPQVSVAHWTGQHKIIAERRLAVYQFKRRKYPYGRKQKFLLHGE